MSLGTEMLEEMTINNAVLHYSKSTNKSMYGNVTHWKTKGGKLIALKDMTDIHLENTINMLRRQIDGSIHDEFVYDNIIAMENELKRRNSK